MKMADVEKTPTEPHDLETEPEESSEYEREPIQQIQKPLNVQNIMSA